MENELTEREQAAVALANDHWAYIRQIIYHDCVNDKEIERIGFHYKAAFVHGFKHAEEALDNAPGWGTITMTEEVG